MGLIKNSTVILFKQIAVVLFILFKLPVDKTISKLCDTILKICEFCFFKIYLKFKKSFDLGNAMIKTRE